MKYIVEVDFCASSPWSGNGKDYPKYYTITAKDFAEAKRLSQEISDRNDVYLVSLYRFDPRLFTGWGHREPRAHIQRHGGKLHSAGSAYYRKWESPAHTTCDFLVKCGNYQDTL